MKTVKTLTTLCMGLLLVFATQAQQDKSKRPSPPAEVKKEINGTTVTVNYSKPSKRGRTIFGELEPYGKVWRTGANESTWIEFSNEVKVEGKKLAAGRYGLFTIPGADEWVIIFNSVSDKWGAFSYKEKDDVLRVTVKPSKTTLTEVFDISISDDGNVVLAWDETQVAFAVK
ncbi:MAG: DUF2911 domain-containing protein [Cyclobacteriaceae bacterium]